MKGHKMTSEEEAAVREYWDSKLARKGAWAHAGEIIALPDAALREKLYVNHRATIDSVERRFTEACGNVVMLRIKRCIPTIKFLLGDK